MKYDIITQDAIIYLQQNKNNKIVITSLPDLEEINADFDGWLLFVNNILEVLINSLSDDAIVFFYQTDRKYNGKIIDKKSIISNVFHKHNYNTVLSKIVLKQQPETINLFRPTFTNLFGFSKKISTGKATPDVINCGSMIYKNAMGYNACKCCIDFLKLKNIIGTVLDPFCGQGSVIKIANDMGYDAIGVDIDANQTLLATQLLQKTKSELF